MSTWTDEKHKAARELVGHGHLGRTIYSALTEALGYLTDALDEIERRRALTTITDAMVERAAIQLCAEDRQDRFWAILSTEEKDYFRVDARAALEAALNPPT